MTKDRHFNTATEFSEWVSRQTVTANFAVENDEIVVGSMAFSAGLIAARKICSIFDYLDSSAQLWVLKCVAESQQEGSFEKMATYDLTLETAGVVYLLEWEDVPVIYGSYHCIDRTGFFVGWDVNLSNKLGKLKNFLYDVDAIQLVERLTEEYEVELEKPNHKRNEVRRVLKLILGRYYKMMM